MFQLSEDIRLCPIQPADHARHLALLQRIYPPAFAYLWPDAGAWYLNRVHREEALLADLAQTDASYDHVYYQDKLIGILRLKMQTENPDFPGASSLKLDRLYLDDAVRGKGIGTTIIEFVKAETLRLGKSHLWLERMDTNDATIGFYRKNDFVDGGTFRLPFENMHPEYRGMFRMSWWP